MRRITVDVNEEWPEAAGEALGTPGTAATINEALRLQAVRAEGQRIADAFARAEMDFSGSAEAFRYGGGRDLDRLEALTDTR